VAALAPRLEPADAARITAGAARVAVEGMGVDNFSESQDNLADAVAALAPQLQPGDVSAIARKAADRMGNVLNARELSGLAGAVAALAPRLEPEDASAAARLAVEAMKKTDDAYALGALAGAVAALAPRLQPGDASAAARLAMKEMEKETDFNVLSALATVVAVLIVESGSEDASQPISRLALALGGLGAPPTLFAALAPLAEASRPLPGRFSEQQLVDLLKMPTCRAPARQVIVEQLGRQCGQPFADQWEFVEWAREHRPDLDLTSPPVRPTGP
jgi:hypothetical protein